METPSGLLYKHAYTTCVHYHVNNNIKINQPNRIPINITNKETRIYVSLYIHTTYTYGLRIENILI